MKKPLYILIVNLLFIITVQAQHYKKVDSIVSLYPKKFKSTAKLAKRINQDFTNDFEKVRAVFDWISYNIAYDIDELKKYKKYRFTYSSPKEYKEKEFKQNKKIASRVLIKHRAICSGYTALFNSICQDLGITTITVSGAAKTRTSDIGRRFHINHSWNIVIINNKKYLVDATWGSGSYDIQKKRFKQKTDYDYYLVDPLKFIKRHYPEHYRDALLDENINKKTFSNYPLYYSYDFKLISPQNGIISKKNLKKIKFSIKLNYKASFVSYEINNKYYDVKDYKNDNYLEFTLDLSKYKRLRDIVIYVNDDALVAYKIK